MRAVVQRVSRAKVTVSGEVSGEIGPGLMVLLGVADDDGQADAAYVAEKLVGLGIVRYMLGLRVPSERLLAHECDAGQ